jgi:hypothetical protein
MAAGYPPVGVASGGNSGLAITSMILGILSLCTGIAAIPAVICGHLALSRINQSNGAVGGRGMAITGLVLGYLAIAGYVIFIIIAIATAANAPQPQY